MTNVIWKFPLQLTYKQTIQMPEGAKILSVQVQNGNICLWALVDPNESEENRTVLIYKTGQPDEDFISWSDFVGTVQLGDYVWHVFECQ